MANAECRMPKKANVERRHGRTALLPFLLAAVLTVPLSTQAQRPNATFLGVLDDQGRLTPIAVYDGSHWWNRWPWAAESEEVRRLPLPRSLSAIPADWLPPGVRLPVDWRALTSVKLVPFHTLRPTRRQDFALMDTVLLSTTYRGQPYAEDTLAISGPGTLRSVVALSNAQAGGILHQLESRIALLEADAIARWREEGGVDGGRRGVALTRIYVSDGPTGTRYANTPPDGDPDGGLVRAPAQIDGDIHYFLLGEKFFQPGPAEECLVSLTTNGLVTVAADGRVRSEKISSGASDQFCADSGDVPIFLGTITVGSQSWWIVKTGVEGGDDYGLIDPRSGEWVEIKGLWSSRPNGRER